MSSFRVFVWDPVLLVSQMVAMQSIFYSIEASFLLLFATIFGYEPNLSTIFALQVSRSGIVAQLIASVVCAFALSVIVQRAKQCLDFACTIHGIHLAWWILQIVSITVCTILGEYLCMRVESQEIRLGQPSKYDL